MKSIKVLDFDFNHANIAAKIVMKPWMLKETFHELDQSSPSVGFRVDPFSLSVITEGDLGKIKVPFTLKFFLSVYSVMLIMRQFLLKFLKRFCLGPSFRSIFFIGFICRSMLFPFSFADKVPTLF